MVGQRYRSEIKRCCVLNTCIGVACQVQHDATGQLHAVVGPCRQVGCRIDGQGITADANLTRVVDLYAAVVC